MMMHAQGYLSRIQWFFGSLPGWSFFLIWGSRRDFFSKRIRVHPVILVPCVWKSGQTTFYKYRQRLQAICFLDSLKKTSKEALFAQAVHWCSSMTQCLMNMLVEFVKPNTWRCWSDQDRGKSSAAKAHPCVHSHRIGRCGWWQYRT